MGTLITSLDRWGNNLIASSSTETTPDLDINNTSGETASVEISVVGKPEDLENVSAYSFPAGFDAINSSISFTDGTILTITAESAGNIFNQDISMKPYYGTAQGFLSHITSACGGMPNFPWKLPLGGGSRWWPGHVGDAWTLIKSLFALEGYDPPTFGSTSSPIRSQEFLGQYITHEESVSTDTGALDVSVDFYEYTGSPELYPGTVDYLEQPVFTLEAGEAIEEEIPLNAWVASVQQPVAVDWVSARPYDTSVYSVTGSDGLPVLAAQWTAHGGSISVELTDDPTILKVRIVAPATPQLLGVDSTVKYAPYSIAMTATEGGTYNSLHIAGTGYPFQKKQVTVRTGSLRGIEEVTVDNTLVDTRAKAFKVAHRTAGNNDGLVKAFSGSTRDPIERGYRIRHRGSWYRVLEVSSNLEEFSFSAVLDTTHLDFKNFYDDMTYSQFATRFSGKTFQQFKINSLKEGS